MHSFNDWMAQVDVEVSKRAGLSVHDLPDCCFRDWYDDEMPAAEAASEALRDASAPECLLA